MTTVQIPPSGVAARFPFTVPAPEGMSTLGGIRVMFTFAMARPDVFVPRLTGSGGEYALMDAAMGATSITRIAQFAQSIPAPADVEVAVNDGGSLQPGNTVTVYAWGAQTESGTGALNPDEGGEPSTMTDTIEVGTVEVLTWEDWNRMTGANQGETGS